MRNSQSALEAAPRRPRKFTWPNIKKDFIKNWPLFIMVLPAIAFYIIFHYIPMGGLLMAFENYKPNKGFLGSDFVGLKNFMDFFGSPFAFRTIRNTLVISFLQLIIEFPLVIVFALLINEIKMGPFRKAVQTLTYMPYFISMVVMAGIIVDFVKSTGVVGQLVGVFTGTPTNLLGDPKYWRPLYIATNLWQGLGFSSIIYVAALSGIDQELYEAVEIDGGRRYAKIRYVTIPHLIPTFALLFILECGKIMSGGDTFNQVYVFSNMTNRQLIDVLDNYILRTGFENGRYSYSTAVNLFKSVINVMLLLSANWVSKKATETSLF